MSLRKLVREREGNRKRNKERAKTSRIEEDEDEFRMN